MRTVENYFKKYARANHRNAAAIFKMTCNRRLTVIDQPFRTNCFVRNRKMQKINCSACPIWSNRLFYQLRLQDVTPCDGSFYFSFSAALLEIIIYSMYVILLKSFCRYKAINGAHGHETLRAERFVPLRGGYKKVASQKKLTRERKICAASRSSSAVYPELIGKIYVSDAISKRSTPPLVKDHCGLLSLLEEGDLFARSLSQSGHIRGN